MVNKFLTLSLIGLLGGLLVQSRPQQSFAQDVPKSTADSVAFLKVKVPADAILEVDGVTLKSTGPVRVLRTPFLPIGKKYSYSFKATYTLNGKKEVVEKKILVEPGKEIEVDFLPAVTPKKIEEPKKEVPKKEVPKKEETKKEVKLDVPYVPTPDPVVEAMLKLAEVKERTWCTIWVAAMAGSSSPPSRSSRRRRAWVSNSFPLASSCPRRTPRRKASTSKVEIREGSVFDLKSVSEASVVTLYLLPETQSAN